VFVTQYSTTTY